MFNPRKLFPIFVIVISFLTSISRAQTTAPTPPPPPLADNLVTENIPPIPASLSEDLSRYTEFRAASFTSWHPTDRQMLILTRFADSAQVHLVKFPLGARNQLTFFKDGIDDATFQPIAGEYFLFAKDIGGNEDYQKYRYDFATGDITLLTDGKSRNTGGVWNHAGNQYAYESNRRNGTDGDLYLMNPADPKSDHLLAELKGGGWEALDFSPDDRSLLVMEFISANESYLWLFDLATGNRTPLTLKTPGDPVLYGAAQFSKDGKGFYTTTDLGSEFQRLTYIDLATKKHTYLSDAIHWDIDEFQLSWDGKLLAFVANEDGLAALHLLDAATGKELPLPKLPVGQLSGLQWHKNNHDLGFRFTSARSTADAYSLDVTTGKIDRWTQSETGGLNTENFSEPQLVHWKSFDGKTISGWLTLPPAKFTGKRPVVMDIHGGPEAQARPGFQGSRNYYMNVLGVALLEPNIRGSSGYGKTFLKLDDGFLREDSYKDIAALLDWINTQPNLDSDRILVRGGSYGGHMTLAVATFYADRIRCAMDIVGPSNLVTFLEHTSSYRQDLRRVEYGDERDPKMREFLNRIAPMNNAAKITKPLFIVQGGNDPRVPLSEATQMLATLKAQNTPVWYLMAKDEGHGFAKKKNTDYLIASYVLFMKQYLLN